MMNFFPYHFRYHHEGQQVERLGFVNLNYVADIKVITGQNNEVEVMLVMALAPFKKQTILTKNPKEMGNLPQDNKMPKQQLIWWDKEEHYFTVVHRPDEVQALLKLLNWTGPVIVEEEE